MIKLSPKLVLNPQLFVTKGHRNNTVFIVYCPHSILFHIPILFRYFRALKMKQDLDGGIFHFSQYIFSVYFSQFIQEKLK